MSNKKEHFSASQIKTYRRCARLYAYLYVEGRTTPPSDKQVFGSAVHKQLEHWLREAKVPDQSPAGRVAAQGIKPSLLPTPSNELLVEHKFSIPWSVEVDLIGFIDCVVPNEIPLVIDHKTTSGLRWAMTTDELATDPQALLYAIWAMLAFNVPLVECRWVYYCATNPKTGPRQPSGVAKVERMFSASDFDFLHSVEELCDSIREMIPIRERGTLARDLPPTPRGCGAYGGCPFVAECKLSIHDKIEAYFGRSRDDTI